MTDWGLTLNIVAYVYKSTKKELTFFYHSSLYFTIQVYCRRMG